jgi:natural product biosynthesis luciferase-like monooxygenase protein
VPEADGLVQKFFLSPAATGHVQAFLRQHTLDLSTLLQAAWAMLLHQHGSGDELLFGMLSGCPASLSGGDSLVGRFAHLVPRRIQVARGGTRLRWLRGLQAELSDARSDEAGTPALLRACLDVPEGIPLFDSVLTTGAEEAPLKPLARRLGFHSLTHTPAHLPAPLVISAIPGPRLALQFLYDAQRLASTAVARLAGHLGALLEELALHSDTEAPAHTPPPGEPGAATDGRRDAAGSVTVGTRFGPAEAEAVLAQHPAVAKVTVVPDERAPGSGRLVARVVPARPAAGARQGKPGFGLFFFANEDASARDRYRLYLEGARLADRHGFTAIWTPERHFDEHGGLYPNPSVLTASLATITERIGLRAGSVVLPLHHPLREAEEWSVIDILSKGRAGMAVTSGWMPQDFALAPEHFASKREVLFRSLAQVRELWRGGAVPFPEGAGKEVPLRTFPRPIQPELPVWLTCPGNPDLFEKAGELGLNVLTSLASQSVEEVRDKIGLYRAARGRAGHDPAAGTVTVMLHTYVGKDSDEVLDAVREPLTRYLRTHLRLQEMRIRSLDLQVDINDPQWLDSLASFAFELHYRMSALIGTPTSCLPMVDRLAEIGADELACFIDFGVDENAVLAALSHLVELKQLVEDGALRMRRVLSEYLEERLPGLPPLSFELSPDPGGG